MGCIALVRCVLVLRCGLAGVVWYPDAGFSHQDDARSNKRKKHPDTTPPQPNHNVTPTHIDQSKTTHEITQQISRKLLRLDVLPSETC